MTRSQPSIADTTRSKPTCRLAALATAASLVIALGCAQGETGGGQGGAGANSGLAGNGPAGSGPAGSGPAGSGPAGSGPGGRGGSDVSGVAGTGGGVSPGQGGSGPAGSGPAGNGPGGAPAGSGGMASARGGAAGTSSAGGAGGSATGSGGGGPATPSAGCGKAGRPGSVNIANAIVTFPDGYDGSKPMPLLFGLHGAGRTNDQFRTVDAKTQGTDLEKHFVMAYVKSAGNGWVLNTDTTRINAVFDTLKNDYCVDTSRVYLTGHSSGAQMITQLLCAGDHRFRAVAPVASSMYCASWTPGIPTLLIHGKNDSERQSTNQDANGQKDLGPYVKSNGCDMTPTTPYDVGTCSSSGTQVAPGCVSYPGCDAELVWCNHNDPNYSNTNHGWPCFANKAIYDFLVKL